TIRADKPGSSKRTFPDNLIKQRFKCNVGNLEGKVSSQLRNIETGKVHASLHSVSVYYHLYLRGVNQVCLQLPTVRVFIYSKAPDSNRKELSKKSISIFVAGKNIHYSVLNQPIISFVLTNNLAHQVSYSSLA